MALTINIEKLFDQKYRDISVPFPVDGTGSGVINESDVVNLVSDLAAKAPLASPALTGNPTAPTQSPGTNSTRIATTAYVDAAAAIGGSTGTVSADDLGAIADGSTDNSAVLRTALTSANTIVVTLKGGNSANYMIKHPVIIPNGTRLQMAGSFSTGSCLQAHSTFPHTTTSGGTQTTPASSATTFTLTVASTAAFPLGTGGLTSSQIGSAPGVITVDGITIFYTGVTSTTFTGCRTHDTSVAIPTSTPVGVPMIWLGYPGSSVGQSFGSGITDAKLDGNNIAGCAIHTSHIQENTQIRNIHILDTIDFGLRVDNCPQAAAQLPVNWQISKMNIEPSASASANCVGFDVFTPESTIWDGRCSVSDISVVGDTTSGTNIGLAALRFNNYTGHVTDIHMERFNDGILVGDKYACNIQIENISAGDTGFNATGSAFVHLSKGSGNPQFVEVKNVYKSVSGDHRFVFADDSASGGTGFTTIDDEWRLDYYRTGFDRTTETSSPTYLPAFNAESTIPGYIIRKPMVAENRVSPWYATTYDRLMCNSNSSTALTSGRLYLVRIWLPQLSPVTHIGFFCGTTTMATPTHRWYGLFDNNLNMLANTADATSTAAWTVGETVSTLAVAKSNVSSSTNIFWTTYSGFYYLGLSVSASTMPNLSGIGWIGLMGADNPIAMASDTSKSTPPSYPYQATTNAPAPVVPYGGVQW